MSYPTEVLMQSAEVQQVDELIAILEDFKTGHVNNIEINVEGQDKRICITDALVKVQLLERTLSDDSKMHDISLTFSEYCP